MPAIKVLYNHELSDFVADEQIFEAADLNSISITEALVPGVSLDIPEQKRATLSNDKLQSIVKPTTVKSLSGQTWVDLVLQQLGDEHRLFELCDMNGAGITDVINAGTIVTSPEAEPDKKRIVNILAGRKPASSFVVTPGEDEPEGIEFWAIEFDFIVS